MCPAPLSSNLCVGGFVYCHSRVRGVGEFRASSLTVTSYKLTRETTSFYVSRIDVEVQAAVTQDSSCTRDYSSTSRTALRAQAAVSHPEHVGWTGMCLTTCLRLDTEGGIQPRAARVSLSPRVKTHHRQHIQLHFTPDYALTKF